jgi:hypothetical protein
MSPAPEDRSFERSSEPQARLHELVPGDAHTFGRFGSVSQKLDAGRRSSSSGVGT